MQNSKKFQDNCCLYHKSLKLTTLLASHVSRGSLFEDSKTLKLKLQLPWEQTPCYISGQGR
jgi:hypothetical protein